MRLSLSTRPICCYSRFWHSIPQADTSHRFVYKLWIFSVLWHRSNGQGPDNLCKERGNHWYLSNHSPPTAKWSTSTPLISLRQRPQDLQCAQWLQKALPEKNIRPRGKPASSKGSTKHSDITPRLNPGHRNPKWDPSKLAWQRSLWSSLTDPRLQRDALDPPWQGQDFRSKVLKWSEQYTYRYGNDIEMIWKCLNMMHPKTSDCWKKVAQGKIHELEASTLWSLRPKGRIVWSYGKQGNTWG